MLFYIVNYTGCSQFDKINQCYHFQKKLEYRRDVTSPTEEKPLSAFIALYNQRQWSNNEKSTENVLLSSAKQLSLTIALTNCSRVCYASTLSCNPGCHAAPGHASKYLLQFWGKRCELVLPEVIPERCWWR